MEFYDQIRQALMNKGLFYWQAYEKFVTLDALVFTSIAQELVGKMDGRKTLELYDFLKTHPDITSLANFLGIAQEGIESLHRQRLTESKEELEKMNLNQLQKVNSI